jgi:ribosomal protein L7Ae-like RNA K-turn-binding protein
VTKEDGPREERHRRRPEVDSVSLQRLYRLIGLGVRSRGATVGVEQVRDAAKRNKLALAVVASDASANSLKKVVPLLNARRVRFIEVQSAKELGAAVGRETTAVVGIVDRQLAAGVQDAVTREEDV